MGFKSAATQLFVHQTDVKKIFCEGLSYAKRYHVIMSPWMQGDRCMYRINTLRPRQNGRHFPDDTFKCIFLFENMWIWIKISLKFVPKVRINNIPALFQIMAWRRISGKPLSEPMMVNLLRHICVTRPQWVNKSGRSPKVVAHVLLQILVAMQYD